MWETVYIIVGLLTFFAQLRNGLISAILTAILWPIALGILVLSPFILGVLSFFNKSR
jgi:hypothetical protein